MPSSYTAPSERDARAHLRGDPAHEVAYGCQRCAVRALSRRADVTPMHMCVGLGGVTAPLVPDGVSCDVRTVVREDYVGNELVQHDDRGRPIMSVVVTRADGQDCYVLAPCAVADVADRRM